MPVGFFDKRLQHIVSDTSGSDTNMRRCVPMEERLAVTLQKVYINSLHVFASFTIVVLPSGCVNVTVIDGSYGNI
jgi:hypothetical protein